MKKNFALFTKYAMPSRRKNIIVVLLNVTIGVCTIVSLPAFCLNIQELQQKAEACGSFYFHQYNDPCEKEVGIEYYRCMGQGYYFRRLSEAFASQCVEKYTDQIWFTRILKCEARKSATQYIKENKDNIVASKFLSTDSIEKLDCDPLPTPEEVIDDNKLPKLTFDKPKNLSSPVDGAEIVWPITKDVGTDTIHLGISLSDKSFWQYTYGSHPKLEPASLEEEKQLLAIMQLWEMYGIVAEDLSVNFVGGCCHFKTTRGGVVRGILYPNLLNPCSRKAPVGVDGHWIPTRDQINKLEEALPAFLASIGRNNLAVAFDKYNFFYLGIMVGKNAIIYVDADKVQQDSTMRRELAQDWQPKMGEGKSCDGGETSWGVEYNPFTSTFKNFSVNGDG